MRSDRCLNPDYCGTGDVDTICQHCASPEHVQSEMQKAVQSLDNDDRRLTATEHVREAMHAEMRSYEQQLATAFDHIPPRVVYPPTLPPPPIGISFADLGVLLIVAAACGMLIGAVIVTFWWG